MLTRLVASGNGVDGVAKGGSTYYNGTHTWEYTGIPYVVRAESAIITKGAALTIEPGVEVWFENSATLEVTGTLTAIGTKSRPITFTGTSKTPGSWEGIRLYGSLETPAVGALSYATIEYGGLPSSGGLNANLYVRNGQVRITHSIICSS